MDELQRSIRLATGREKMGLLRRREYMEEAYSMQEGRRGVEQDRARQVQQWEIEQFNRQKTHFEEVTRLQAAQFAMQERHILERYNLEREQIEQRKRDMEEIWALEDQRRALQETWEDRSQQYYLEDLERQKDYYENYVFRFQSERNDMELEALKLQKEERVLREGIEDAHADYLAWQMRIYQPGGQLYAAFEQFVRDMLALMGADDEPDQQQGPTGGRRPRGSHAPSVDTTQASTSLADQLFSGLNGMQVNLVLDDGTPLRAHIETVAGDAQERKNQSGGWGSPWR
jgi:hypothetical protein